MGVVSLGGSIGVLIFGPFLQLLLDGFGWRGTFRITSALLSLACVCGGSFSEPLDDGNDKRNRICAEKSFYLKYSTTEEATTKDAKSAENTGCDIESSNSAFEDEESGKVDRRTIVECNPSTNVPGAKEEKASISVILAKTSDTLDAKVEDKGERGKLMDFSVFKVPRFTIVVISLTLMCLGHYTPQLHLVSYRKLC